MENINWMLFKQEEKTEILKALKAGDYKNIACIITGMGDMTPEKELEVQRMVDFYTPIDEDFESEVQAEVDKKFTDADHNDQSPEEEARWQKKLDDEKAKFVKKTEKAKAARLKNLEIKKEEVTTEDVTPTIK